MVGGRIHRSDIPLFYGIALFGATASCAIAGGAEEIRYALFSAEDFPPARISRISAILVQRQTSKQ